MRHLMKLKVTGKGVLVKYIQTKGRQEPEVRTIESGEPPLAELGQALDRMLPYLMSTCDLPPDWLPELRAEVVSVDDENAVQIHGRRTLDTGLSFEIKGPKTVDKSDIFRQHVAEGEAEALRYVDGHRGQLELPLEEAGAN